jgi:hypothetical protein
MKRRCIGVILLLAGCPSSSGDPQNGGRATTVLFERRQDVPAGAGQPLISRFAMADFGTRSGVRTPTFGAGRFTCSGVDLLGTGKELQVSCWTEVGGVVSFGIDFACEGHSARSPQRIRLSGARVDGGGGGAYTISMWCE